MKNLIILAVLAGIIWFGWMKAVIDFMPDQQAKDFVEEARLGIDNGVLSHHFSWSPPLPKERFEVPSGGISQEFKVERQSGPSYTDRGAARTIRYLVRFRDSDQARTQRNKDFEYRLVMRDAGSYFFPNWEVREFRPASSRPLRGEAQ